MPPAGGTVIFDKFNPIFKKPVTMIIVAPRGSGKSVFLAEILQRNRTFFDDVFVYAGSNSVYNDYVNKLPPSRLFMGWDDDRLKKLVKHANDMTERNRKSGKHGQYNIALVLDDLAFQKDIFKSKVHLECWLNSRHFFISIFLCIQFVTSVPPVIRAQADIVVALKESIKANQKRLHEFFFGVFSTFVDFQKVLNKATDNYGALVVNNRANSSLLTECVFVYRASDNNTDGKRLCSDVVWKIEKRASQLSRYRECLEKNVALKQESLESSGGLVMDGLISIPASISGSSSSSSSSDSSRNHRSVSTRADKKAATENIDNDFMVDRGGGEGSDVDVTVQGDSSANIVYVDAESQDNKDDDKKTDNGNHTDKEKDDSGGDDDDSDDSDDIDDIDDIDDNDDNDKNDQEEDVEDDIVGGDDDDDDDYY